MFTVAASRDDAATSSPTATMASRPTTLSIVSTFCVHLLVTTPSELIAVIASTEPRA